MHISHLTDLRISIQIYFQVSPPKTWHALQTYRASKPATPQSTISPEFGFCPLTTHPLPSIWSLPLNDLHFPECGLSVSTLFCFNPASPQNVKCAPTPKNPPFPQNVKGTVHPALMELPQPRVKVQCAGRGCDDHLSRVTESQNMGFYKTLPLFGRENVVISLVLTQVLRFMIFNLLLLRL